MQLMQCINLQLNCSISDCVYSVTNKKTDCAWGLVIWHILTTKVNIWISVCRSTRVDHQRRDIRCILTSRKQQQHNATTTVHPNNAHNVHYCYYSWHDPADNVFCLADTCLLIDRNWSIKQITITNYEYALDKRQRTKVIDSSDTTLAY